MTTVGALDRIRGRRVAVLGADGFIGAMVTQLALEVGASHVNAICRREPWRLVHLDDARLTRHALEQWWHPEAQGRLASLVAGHDALILLAYEAPSGDDVVARAHHETTINAMGAVRVARTAASNGVRVVFASSASVYGSRDDRSWREDDLPQPVTPYGVAKLAAEQLVAITAPDSVSLRLATVYGPGENGARAVPSFVRAALLGQRVRLDNGGVDVRDYVHVRDVATALLAAAASDVRGVVNVGSGVALTTRQVLDLVRAHVGEPSGVDEVPASRAASRVVLDVGRTRALLGFVPGADLGPGIVEEAEWLARHLGARRRPASAPSP